MEWILLTGQPGSGKTTGVKRIYDALAAASAHTKSIRFSGFYTEEVLDRSGTRIGFDVVTIPDFKRGVLSRKCASGPKENRVGKYMVDVESFETLALPKLQSSDYSKTIFVLDEIGRMELKSPRFRDAVELLVKNRVKLLGAITAPIYGHRVPFCDKVSAMNGVEVFKLKKGTRDSVVGDLAKRLTSSWIGGSSVHTSLPVLELYFKQLSDLKKVVHNVVLPMSERMKLGGCLLTYKDRNDAESNPEACARLRKLLPSDFDIHTVWSSKFSPGSLDAAAEHLASYALAVKASSVLVVSGTGKKKASNSVTLLEKVPNFTSRAGCAFNPYIGCSLDPREGRELRRCEEYSRLAQKLSCKCVSSVWLQFGVDATALQDGLAHLKKFLEMKGRDNVRIFGSVFIPSKSWVAKMKFRCWSGVFLGSKEDGDYFNGGAVSATRRVLKIYADHGVTPLIESSVRSERDVHECIEFMESCCCSVGERQPRKRTKRSN